MSRTKQVNLRSSRRVLAACQRAELERQKHFQTNHAVFAPWCEVCVQAKGTGAQHRRQTIKELAKQELDESTQTSCTCRRQELLLRCLR